MPFLPVEDIEYCFVDNIMSIAPEEDKCYQFADYVLQTYIATEAKFPHLGGAAPDETMKYRRN
jgi:hypothetical protein